MELNQVDHKLTRNFPIWNWVLEKAQMPQSWSEATISVLLKNDKNKIARDWSADQYLFFM